MVIDCRLSKSDFEIARVTTDFVFNIKMLKLDPKLLFCKERNVDYKLRKNDSLDLVSMYSRTNSFKYSYFILIINEWNSLPNDIKESVSISSFKRKVIAFLGNT